MSPSSSSPAPSSRRPLRILYADDVRELRDVARISLAREGHSITCVDDGRQAYDLLAAENFAFDLLITDHHMPMMNGLQLVTQVRATPFAGKILVFCSELNPVVGEAYRRFNVDRVLYKPVFPSDLRRVLAEMFPPVPAPSSAV
jgi:CheY-like chemotaxis protein